jgi:N utilization substance protein B
MNNKISPKKRYKARCFLVQALYEWQMAGNPVNEILLTFLTDMNPKKSDTDYFRDLLRAISSQISDIDASFVPYLDRPIDEIGPVELAVLRIATYELKDRLELPYKVVIDQAIELAKTFGPEESYKYINSILDKVAEKFRRVETNIDQ